MENLCKFNAAIIANYLESKGYRRLKITYSGGGDSGSVDQFEIDDEPLSNEDESAQVFMLHETHPPMLMPGGIMTHGQALHGALTPLPDAIAQCWEDFIHYTGHSDFGDGDGGDGVVYLAVDGTLELEHADYSYDTDTIGSLDFPWDTAETSSAICIREYLLKNDLECLKCTVEPSESNAFSFRGAKTDGTAVNTAGVILEDEAGTKSFLNDRMAALAMALDGTPEITDLFDGEKGRIYLTLTPDAINVVCEAEVTNSEAFVYEEDVKALKTAPLDTRGNHYRQGSLVFRGDPKRDSPLPVGFLTADGKWRKLNQDWSSREATLNEAERYSQAPNQSKVMTFEAIPDFMRQDHASLASYIAEADQQGVTRLAAHCAYGYHLAQAPELIEALQGHPVLEQADSNGYRPLHIAAMHDRMEVVRKLLELGVEVTATTHKGNTPLDLAKERNHKAIVAMLESELKARALEGVTAPTNPSSARKLRL